MSGQPDTQDRTAQRLAELARWGRGEAPGLSIADAALAASGLDHPSLPLAPFRAHLAELAADARSAARALRKPGIAPFMRALNEVMAARHGYDGDRLTYDDPQNADMVRVIERRRGLPVALGILYLHAARAAGADAAGLDTPAHFAVRIAHGGEAALIDPFNGGNALDLARIEAAIAGAAGQRAISVQAGETTDRAVIVRLLNNQRVRAAGAGDRARVRILTERMALIDPKDPRLQLELGEVLAQDGALMGARAAFAAAERLAGADTPIAGLAKRALGALTRQIN